jgi:hypothetical protein
MVNRDELISIARSLGMARAGSSGQVVFNDELEKLAQIFYKRGYDLAIEEIEAAVRNENEACAKISDTEADEYGVDTDEWYVAKSISSRIRERNQ